MTDFLHHIEELARFDILLWQVFVVALGDLDACVRCAMGPIEGCSLDINGLPVEASFVHSSGALLLRLDLTLREAETGIERLSGLQVSSASDILIV